MNPSGLLLRRRRRRRRAGEMSTNSDGLMDVLSNVVGVMALVGSLTGVFAAASSLNIQAPMPQKEADRNFWMLQASAEESGICSPLWIAARRSWTESGWLVNRCEQLLPPEQAACERDLDGWSRGEQLVGRDATQPCQRQSSAQWPTDG